jgi:hypothetical protein
MKQTLESAAINELFFSYACTSRNLSFEGLVYDRNAMLNMFRKGAEWQAKQSSWISVKEKAGCDSSNDCIVMDSDGEVFRACFIRNKWLKYNRGYYVIDNVTHWMPIPSFD